MNTNRLVTLSKLGMTRRKHRTRGASPRGCWPVVPFASARDPRAGRVQCLDGSHPQTLLCSSPQTLTAGSAMVYNHHMKINSVRLGVVSLAFGLLSLTACAEDYQLLKAKTGILVEQAQEFYSESRQKESYVHGAAYQYYFTLIHTTGTNLLARSESPTNEKLLRAYFNLVKKDYEAYTKVNAATDKAAATGSLSGNAGSRHRAKRLVNAEKLRDKELTAAIKRWEKFVGDMKKSAKR